jgi:hypothetical protein
MNVPYRFRNGHGNGQERWTVRDVERYATIILYKINGLKRLQNHVHGTATVRSRFITIIIICDLLNVHNLIFVSCELIRGVFATRRQ